MPREQQRDEARPFRMVEAAGKPAAIAAAEGDGAKLGTFTGTAYTGGPMVPQGWWNPVVVDLAGVKVPNPKRPVLRQHDHEQIVGHTETVDVTATGIDIAGVFSGERQHTDTVIVPAKNGFPWQLSIGANPVRTEFLEAGAETEVNGRTVTGPLTISRETELGEISFVPLGADGNTSATVSASRGGKAVFHKTALKLARTQGYKAAAKYSDDAIDKMSDDEAKAALKKCMAEDDKPAEADDDAKAKAKAKAADGDEEEKEKKAEARLQRMLDAATQRGIEAMRAAQAAENQRVADIRTRVARHGITTVEVETNGVKARVDLANHAIVSGWTPDTAELHALRAARDQATASVLPGGLVYSTSAPQVSDAVVEAAILHTFRHQLRLQDDSFYFEPSPDGKGTVRRVPEYVQREAQADFSARYTDQVQQYAHTMFKGRAGLHQIIQLAFRANGNGMALDLKSEPGIRSMMAAWHHMEQHGIRAEGASALSISNVLANVMNKFALQGYLFTEQSWREFCAIRPVNDFKPAKSINLLGDVMYKKLGPSGEIENASLGDQAFANQADPYGRLLTIPWTHIVNDDLGILGTVPLKIGQGGGLALLDVIWTLMKNMAAGTVNGDDGNAFWRTTSSVTAAAAKAGTAYKPNKMSGGTSAFGDTALKTAKALFDNQIDPNGNPIGFDGLTPILLHGPTLWRDVTAQMQSPTIVYGGGTAALAASGNPWQGLMKPVMSRYIENANYVNSATAFWILFNPVALAVIEVCFLNGVDNPAVLQAGPDFQFDKLGISIRGTMPFGANQQNFRGGVYSVGA